MTEPVIALSNIKKRYLLGEETLEVLKGIDLLVEANEYVALTGPSGSGKSTLMNIIGCLDTPSDGEYSLAGVSVASLNENELAEAR
ncbi:MAG: ATP-binding cassette domain-containing protein, partial [Gammaproteobacteria bacterium]|nr:ATP-binding cassette domain-containing protein [Gammaproteobacteria bacterium]